MNRVLLMSLPWATPIEPNLGLAVLKAVYNKAGIPCDVYECQLELLRWVQNSTYEEIAQSWALCDFVFTGELEPGLDVRRLEILERICSDTQGHDGEMNFKQGAEERLAKALKLRQEIVPKFLDAVMEKIDLSQYCLIGFTCLFDQTFSSLALAQRIRKVRPDLRLVFGGYALQEPVGPHLQMAFPELMDIVAYGDGEPTLVPLYEAALGKRSLAEVPNISYLGEDGRLLRTPALAGRLEESPTPDFDDFFRQRDELEADHKVRIAVPSVPVESSRGCWWGQKSHCVFCGIDDETMKYRVKPPEQVLADLDALNERYGVLNFRFSDYILPHAYYRTLLPELVRRKLPYRIQYESKANMTPQKLDLVRDAGLFYMQLGIESFSTPVLKRMKKGVTTLQNIFSIHGLMKRGITPYYNLLFGFPGDEASDYEQMIETLPAIFHLKPPGLCIWVQATRFAPMAERPQDFGFDGPLPYHWRYDALFSEPFLRERGIDLSKICYYFENYNQDLISPEVKGLFSILQQQWWHWRDREKHMVNRLSYRLLDDGGIEFRDTRTGLQEKVRRFGPVHREVYQSIEDQIVSEERILRLCSHLGEEPVLSALADLRAAQVVFREDSNYICLAFSEQVYEQKIFWWLDDEQREGFLHNNHRNIQKRRRELAEIEQPVG